MISSEACRLRWSELDAEQWSEVAPGTTALDTVFMNCVSDEVLKQTQGKMPTFDELANISSGMKPRYMENPPYIPPIDAFADKDDIDTDFEDDDNSENHSILSNSHAIRELASPLNDFNDHDDDDDDVNAGVEVVSNPDANPANAAPNQRASNPLTPLSPLGSRSINSSNNANANVDSARFDDLD